MPPGDNGTNQFRERFVRSFLEWVMLSVLQRKPSYGYEIITTIDRDFGVYISPGSLYPILYNLERAGYATGAWDHPERKSRKVYTITPEGERALREGLDSLGRVLGSLRRDAETP
ncbi:MAG TPA: PadR family transcriptional regulator [Thermoplasmata archaeon]|jgi:DNA-binding PadR family transcriptional regulator|nr:PadR family transcriptional regulator [Thermoplasmata archaeon]